MPTKPLDLLTLRGMARAVVDIELTNAELERIKPYVERYLQGMEKIASIDLTSVEPESLNPASFLK
jgi:hypothetical protein